MRFLPGYRLIDGMDLNAAIDEATRVVRDVILPIGGTAERPATPTPGQQYYDTEIGAPIWFDGADWKNAMGAIV